MPGDDPPVTGTTEAFEQAIARMGTERYVLRLYVAGNSPRSQRAIENVRRICDEYMRDRCELEIIDIYQAKTTLNDDVIVAAPTLLRRLPLPLRRIIGDLSEKEKVVVGLELLPGA